MTTATLDLAALQLAYGAHKATDKEMCVMEAVAFVAGERWSDHPKCASPVLGAFCRSFNDSMDDLDRQKLKPFIPRLVGTNTGKKDDEVRAWLATDWLVRVHMPAWLELAGLTDVAVKVRGLPPLTSSEIAAAVSSVLEEARASAAAAGAAAWAAAWAAAGDAAWAAAGDAAGAAAWAAAGAAARAAAGDAAGAAAWAAAWAAARAAAGDAAGDAAWAAAGDAAGDAAWEHLRPTKEKLQATAFDLLDRMIQVGQAA